MPMGEMKDCVALMKTVRMHLKHGTMIVCVPEDIRGKYAGEEILLMLTFM